MLMPYRVLILLVPYRRDSMDYTEGELRNKYIRLLRFCKRTPTGCLEYSKHKSKARPYINAARNGPTKPATHLVWRIFKGEWPTEFVLHRCDNPHCLELEHLFLGTQEENVTDMLRKKRSWFHRLDNPIQEG